MNTAAAKITLARMTSGQRLVSLDIMLMFAGPPVLLLESLSSQSKQLLACRVAFELLEPQTAKAEGRDTPPNSAL